jgi:HAD superfamily hydrolase (TIGR01549 family)
MKYDGIFFDSGGTLFSFKSTEAGPDPGVGQVSAQGPERAATALRWLGHQVEDGEVAQHLAELAALLRTMGPAYTQEDLMRTLFERLGKTPRADEVVYVTGVYSGPRYRSWLFPGVGEVLEELHALGIPMGLIANTDVPGWVMDRNFRGVGLFHYFPVRLYSGDEGIEKPDPRIFELAAERANLSGRRLIYMGDRVDKDVAGASAAGWSSILFRSALENSGGAADFEIDSWSELKAILLE